MIASIALSAALWPATVIETCSPPENVILVGIAQNADREFLYCEHFIRIDENHFQANYLRDNTIFAKKDLDYSLSKVSPNVMQTDDRSGEIREATTSGKDIMLRYKKNRTSAEEKTYVARTSLDALDAGFNNYILANWEKLSEGNDLPIHFGSIAHQKNLALRVSKRPPEKCKNNNNQQYVNDLSCFSVEIDNRLLRLLIGGIKLTYDKQRRLHEFDGTVNIDDDKQKSQNALIRYYYRNDYTVVSKAETPKSETPN
jgi:hypothetical protein